MSAPDAPLTIPTTEGDARVRLRTPRDAPGGAVMLGHGAGGGVDAPDIRVAAQTALQAGWAVALVDQPYRVLGRRSPAPGPKLDAAWVQVAMQLTGAGGRLAGLRLVAGGRSSGARVACRTAPDTGAIGVLCLAFPLQPPARRGSGAAASSRQPELDGAGVPVLVVQGASDRFGMPEAASELGRIVVRVEGDHGLKRDHAEIANAIDGWLRALPAATRASRSGRAAPRRGSR